MFWYINLTARQRYHEIICPYLVIWSEPVQTKEMYGAASGIR